MGFEQHDVEELSRGLGEPAWLLERRLEAWGYADKLDLPREKDEPWRYTDLRRLRFSLEDFGPAPAPVPELSIDPAVASRGVVLAPLSEALTSHPDLVQRHLFSQGNPGQDVFTALHTALFAGGAFLYVPRGLEVPVVSIGHRLSAGTSAFPHDLIVVEEGAAVVVVQRFSSPDRTADIALSDAGVEIVAGDGASVTFVTLQEYGRGVWHFSTQRSVIGAQAALRSLVVTLGATFSRAQVETTLAGHHGDVQMLGLYFAEADQHFDMRTLQDHVAPSSTSDLLYKGALKDASHTVYSGLIRVQPGAEKTDAYQANRNLVLSDHAKADSKPELEILNNDVRCTHGSTVGQVDADQLFYLQARGVGREDAVRLIAMGFFEDLIQRVGVEDVRDELRGAVERKLAG